MNAAVLPAALVLAGTRPGGDPLATAEGVAHKALIEVGGQPILTRVVAGLRDAGLPRIAVSADDPQVVALARALGCEVFPTAHGPSGSVALAFEQLGAPLLVTTSDHALLQGQWVRDFLTDLPAEADVALLLAPRAAVEAALPGTKRTWLRFADGDWSGCNLFLLAAGNARRAIDTWAGVEADRKRPWRIAFRLGPRVLVSYLLGRLSANGAIAAIGRRVGLGAAVVAARDGLAAVDVDKPSDLADVRRILAARKG